MSGIDPVGVKERELAIAEKRSHSARMAHKRRRDKREALLKSQNADRSRSPAGSNPTDPSEDITGDLVLQLESPTEPRRPTPYGAQSSPSKGSQSSTATTPESTSTIVPYKQLSPTSPIPRIPQNNVRLVFDNNADWLQAFDFWVKVSAPATARYASPYGEVWTRVLPQFAMQSTTVRHMVLAHAYIYAKHFRAFSAGANTFEARALYHYSKGVKEMCTKVSGTEFLAAAKLGYVFEAMLNNFHSAQLHLKGCEAIVSNFKGRRDEQFYLLTASHDVANTITSILTHNEIKRDEKDSPEAIPWSYAPFDTTDGARNMIATIIETIGNGLSPNEDIALGEIKTSLKNWSGTLRKWDAEDAPSAKRSALLLLFNLATALLPTHDVGRLSQAASPYLVEYILKSADDYLNKRRTMNAEDRKDLMTTLRMLANYTIRFVQLPEYQARSRSLLDRIESSSP